MADNEDVYVDTDFLIALTRSDDRLHEEAEEKYERYENRLVAIPSVFLEYSLVTIDWIDDLQTVFANLLELVQYRGDEEVVLRAAYYMDEHELTPFDAFHCAEAHEHKIISSDQKFDKTLVDRIEL